MDKDTVLLNQELKCAQKDQSNKVSNYNKFLKEQRGYSKEFYFQASILSAGILSLSVTFIGYLSSIEGFKINYPEILFLGWIFESISLICGLYRNYFHGHFAHWQAQGDLIKTYLKTERAILDIAENCPDQIYNIESKEELKTFINNKKKQIEVYEKNKQFNKGKEKFYLKLWKFTENATILGFGIGIILIVTFAMLNVPIKIENSLFLLIKQSK